MLPGLAGARSCNQPGHRPSVGGNSRGSADGDSVSIIATRRDRPALPGPDGYPAPVACAFAYINGEASDSGADANTATGPYFHAD